ncbi:MAG: response regulator transcription factor [Actinomycetota bacterium]
MPDAEPLRVALCDDHGVIRSGLRRILADLDGVEVVGEAATAAEAVTVAQTEHPDVFLVDLTLPDDSGISLIGRVAQVSPATRMLVLTMHEDVSYLREAFGAGACGYLLKEAADVELELAVRTVAAGRRYVHPTLGASLLNDDTAEPSAAVPAVDLSPREQEILRLIALGHTNPEIAQKLALSPRTVETHRCHIQQKLGTRKRSELVRYAHQAGLLR